MNYLIQKLTISRYISPKVLKRLYSKYRHSFLYDPNPNSNFVQFIILYRIYNTNNDENIITFNTEKEQDLLYRYINRYHPHVYIS